MKQFTLLPFALLFVVLFTACNKDDEDENISPETGLIGSWQLTDVAYTLDDLTVREYYRQLANDLGASLSDAQLDSIEAAVDAQTEETFEDNTVFTFQPEGVLTISEQGIEGGGTWEVQNSNILVLSDGQDVTEFTIAQLTDSALRLLIEGEQNLGPQLGNRTVTVGLNLVFVKQ